MVSFHFLGPSLRWDSFVAIVFRALTMGEARIVVFPCQVGITKTVIGLDIRIPYEVTHCRLTNRQQTLRCVAQ